MLYAKRESLHHCHICRMQRKAQFDEFGAFLFFLSHEFWARSHFFMSLTVNTKEPLWVKVKSLTFEIYT